jgi:predicted O-methyltransferase YrrM
MQHYWHLLPGPTWFSGTSIYRAQVERAHDGAVFVEIGAWKGRSAAFMAVEIINSGKRIDFYTVDHWLGSHEHAHDIDPDVKAGRLYDVFIENIGAVRNHVTPLRGNSTNVATQFLDRSVDFIYLDAGHTYDDVHADLTAWWPKLKAGGVMAGDDWCWADGVARAVAEFFSARGLEIGTQAGAPNPEWLQWMVANKVI